MTIADSLKASGYRTGYIGKWHLNDAPQFAPSSKGYDLSLIINGPHYPDRYRVVRNPQLKPKSKQYRTDFEAELAVDFINQSKQGPFFLMVSPFAVHIPLGAMPDKVAKYRQRAKERGVELPHPVYAAMIGKIIQGIKDAGVSDNTMIVFTSDNGGLYRRYDYQPAADDNVTVMKPLRGEKGTLYEGGIRVPLIVSLPGTIPADSISDVPAISYDFFPTCVAAAGGKLPANQVIDGKSLMPVLSGKTKQLDRDALFWHYPHYHHSRPASCIRDGDWKLIEFLDGSGDRELFHLAEDIGETQNLLAQQPGKAKSLTQKLNRWRLQTLARMPLTNPSYDPEKSGPMVESSQRQAGQQ